MLRRSFLAGSTGLLSTSLAPNMLRAQELLPLSVQLAWIANVQYGDIWIALERELFAEKGLDISISAGGPNAPNALTMVSAGTADIGYTNWLPFLDAVAQGNDFVLIGATFQNSPLGIISMAGNPILTAEDIPGKRILLQGSSEETAIRATLALSGIEGDWSLVPAGFSPEPLVAGDGDGYTAFATNQTITLEQMGLERDKDFFFRSFDELGFPSYAGTIFVERAFLEANRPALVRYLAALMQAWNISHSEPTLAADLAVNKYGRDYGLNMAQQTRQNELQFDFVWPGGDMESTIFELDMEKMAGVMMDAATATGRTNLPAIDRIADPSLVEEARAML